MSARAHEVTHGCVLMSTEGWSARTHYFFELRRKGVAGHRPRALLVWGVPHHDCLMVDGICVASGTMKEHKAHLEEVFSRLASRGHLLKPKKVKLLQEEVEYLGHISTPEGIKITPGQRDAIIKMPYPLDAEGEVEETRLRRFIGLAN